MKAAVVRLWEGAFAEGSRRMGIAKLNSPIPPMSFGCARTDSRGTSQADAGHKDIASTMRYLRPASAKEAQGRLNAVPR